MKCFLLWIYEEYIMKILTMFSVVSPSFPIIDLIFNELSFSHSRVCFVKTQHYFTVENIFFTSLFLPLTSYYESWWPGKCKELFEFETSCSNKLYKIYPTSFSIVEKDIRRNILFFPSRQHASIRALKKL